MDIAHPAERTFWIGNSGASPVAGVTEPTQVTTFGAGWTLLLQTTNKEEWLAECERLGIAQAADE